MRIRRLSAYFSLAIVVILTTLVFFLSTPLGSKTTIYLVNKFSPIDIGYRKGVILDALEFSHIKLKSDGLSLEIHDIFLDFHLRCLWQKRICIDELSLGEVAFSFISEETESQTSEKNSDDDENLVLFPWSIKTKQFSLNKGLFFINGNEIKTNEFSTAFVLTNNQIKVEHFKGRRLAVLLSKENNQQTSQQPPNLSESWILEELPVISLPVDLQVKNFSLSELVVSQAQIESNNDEQATEATYSFYNTLAELHWLDTQLTLKQLSTVISDPTLITTALSVNGQVDFTNKYPMNIEITNNLQKFSQWKEIGNSVQKTKAVGDLSALKIAIESTGSLAFIAKADIDLSTDLLPFSIDVNADNIPFPQEVSTIAIPSMINFTASGNVEDQIIALSSKVTGFGYQQADVSLQANIKNQKFNIESFHFNDRSSESDLHFSGFVSFNENNSEKLSWQLALDTKGFTLPSIMLVEPEHKLTGKVHGKVFTSGHWHKDSWQVEIKESQLSGIVNEQNIALNGDVSLNSQWHMLPSKFNLSLPNIKLAVEGYTDEQWHVKGQANAHNISQIIKKLPINVDEHIDGNIDTAFTLSGDINTPLILFDGKITDLFTSSLVSDQLLITGQYQPNHNHAFVLNTTSDIIQLQATHFEKFALALKGDFSEQEATLSWLGDTKVDVALKGDWFAEKGYWHGNLSKANLSYLENDISPDGDVFIQVDVAKANVHISKHCWLGEQAQLCLKEDAQLADSGEIDLSIDVGLNFINKVLQKQHVHIDSNVTGEINAKWSPKQLPTVTALLNLSPGSLTIKQDKNSFVELMQWSEGALTFNFIQNKLTGGLGLSSSKNTKLIDFNMDILLEEDYPINGKIKVNQLDLKPIQAFVHDITALEGAVSGELTLAGNIDNPIIEGPLDVNLANVRLLKTPTVIQAAKINLQTQGTRATLTSEMKINNDVASLNGYIDWQHALAFDLALRSDRIAFAIPPQVSTTLKPNVTAKLKDKKLKLAGRIDVLDGMLQIDKLPEGIVAISNDVVIVDDNGVPVKKDEKFEIETDIRLAIADKVKVKGQGFEGYIIGEFQISQQNQQPLQLFGTLKVPQGEYKAYGQHLSVDKGVISFNGAPDNPYIDLRAVRAIDKEDITVGINVKGQANALELSIFSNPLMEQPEALSYLTRGRGLDAQTGGNAAIGMALGKTLTNSSGILNQIEKLPLLNKLEVDGDGNQASIAGYIGDRVYLKYAVGIAEPINELTVRFYILSRLWAETVSGLEESADLYYSFDID